MGPHHRRPLVIGLTAGRAGLKAWWDRIRRFRAPGRVYAAAVLMPLGVVLVSAALAVAAGARISPAAGWSGWTVFLVGIPIVLLDGPIPEELSFRGYGQDRLQQTMPALEAGLWIGLGVLVWHLPVLLGRQIPWPYAIALPAVSIVYAWLYQAGGSVWPLVLLHRMHNLISGITVGRMFSPQDNVLLAGFIAVFYAAAALILAWRLGPSLGRPVSGV